MLSSLQGNNAVTRLVLMHVGLGGQTCGFVLLSALLLYLTILYCSWNQFGVEGSRALQPSLRANQTLQSFALLAGDLGEDGLVINVDATV
jgi:hypothetical protein